MTKMKVIDGLTLLPLPENGESINVRILAPPEYLCTEEEEIEEETIRRIGIRRIEARRIGARCQVLGIKQHFLLKITSIIYKGMLAEFSKAKISVDDDLRCMVGCIFTIAGRQWFQAPKEFWISDEKTGELVPPTTFAIALRKDLMNMGRDMGRQHI